MTHARLAALLVGHALAEGSPVGAALRAVPNGRTAAAEAEAGRLGFALAAVGLEPELVALAQAWPAALLPTVRRLGRLPDRTQLFAPFAQLLSYFSLVLAVYAAVLRVLEVKVLPLLTDLPGVVVQPLWAWWGGVAALVLGGGALVARGLGATERHGWGAARADARRAAAAAALLEVGAPRELSARFGDARDPREADLLFEAAAARVVVVQQRLVAIVRVLGYAALFVLVLRVIAQVYAIILQIPSTL